MLARQLRPRTGTASGFPVEPAVGPEQGARRALWVRRVAFRHSVPRQELAQHEQQDAPVSVVEPLIRGINSYTCLELFVICLDLERAGAVLERVEVERLFAGQAEGLRVLAVRKLQRQYAHADQVRAVDALVALGDDELDALQVWALGRPVTRGPGAVFLARQDAERRVVLAVLDRGVVDRHLLAAREVLGVAALGLRDELIADSHVRERAAPHPLVVAAA